MSTATDQLHQQSGYEPAGWLGRQPGTACAARGQRGHCGQNVANWERIASVAAGAGLGLVGLLRGRVSGLALVGLGGALVYRGVTGHCHGYEALGINTAEHAPATVVPAQEGRKVERSITIQRSPEALYSLWRNLERLPEYMRSLKRVDSLGERRSRWVASGPMGQEYAWDAEIINDRANEMISWRSLPGSDIDITGSVHFTPLSHDRGTEVTVSLKYNPPGGKIGDRVTSWLGGGIDQKINEALFDFKQQVEAGERATVEGQPRGI